MNKLKRLGAFLLIGVTALGTAACGGGGGTSLTSDSTPIEQVDDSDRSGWVPFTKSTFPEGTNILRAGTATIG